MNKIKSSWEIAMERAAKMEVNPEQIQKQLEEKSKLVAMGFADNFLERRDLRELKEELEKRPAEERELIGRNFVQNMVAALELGDYEKMPAIVDGIILATGNDKFDEIKGRFLVLFDAYHNALAKRAKEIENTGKKILERLGIAGDAIKAINPGVSEDWAQNLKDVAGPYEKEFAQYKKELLPG